MTDPYPAAFERLAALTDPAAYRLLTRLGDTGAVSFAEIDDECEGVEDWMGLAKVLRARFAAEGRDSLHITPSGRAALSELSTAERAIVDQALDEVRTSE